MNPPVTSTPTLAEQQAELTGRVRRLTAQLEEAKAVAQAWREEGNVDAALAQSRTARDLTEELKETSRWLADVETALSAEREQQRREQERDTYREGCAKLPGLEALVVAEIAKLAPLVDALLDQAQRTIDAHNAATAHLAQLEQLGRRVGEALPYPGRSRATLALYEAFNSERRVKTALELVRGYRGIQLP